MYKARQPPFTFELDLRGWQSYGQWGSNLVIMLDLKPDAQDLKADSIIGFTAPTGADYHTERVRQVCRFGKQNVFSIYEGIDTHRRYFVDEYQAKTINLNSELAQSFLARSKPIGQWTVSVKNAQAQAVKRAQDQYAGIRIETVPIQYPIF